jgi:hypothetical protein
MERMKKSKTTLILIGLLLILSALAVGMSFAVWIQQEGESVYLEITVDDGNPSVRYQIYLPVDGEFKRIDGQMDVVNREYTLSDPSEYQNIAGYALVGWDGGISFDQMEMPNNYTMKIDGVDTQKPVVAVLVDIDFLEYEFPGNSTIEKITISNNVVFIAQGAFQNMLELSSLRFAGEGDIEIEDWAFAGCHNLSLIDKGRRTIIGDEHLIFFRS